MSVKKTIDVAPDNADIELVNQARLICVDLLDKDGLSRVQVRDELKKTIVLLTSFMEKLGN